MPDALGRVLRRLLDYYAPRSPPRSQESAHRYPQSQDDQRSCGPRHTHSYGGGEVSEASRDSFDRLRAPSEPGYALTSRRQGDRRLPALPEHQGAGSLDGTDAEKKARRRAWKKEVSTNLPDGMKLGFDRDYVIELPDDASERVSRPQRQPEPHP
jgi:hypothetical protein